MLPSNLLTRVLFIAILLTLVVTLVPGSVNAAPPQQGGGFVYFVRPGDTLFWISQRFGTTVTAIMSANGLASDYIQAGQRLIIPVGSYSYYPFGSSIFAPQPLPPITPQANPSFTCTYTVRSGDTIFSIAYRYRVTIASLMQANNLASPLIFVSKPINVPCNNPTPDPFQSYVVAPGDNLLGIAIRNNTTIWALALVNHIPNPNLIFAGQTLVIPYPNSYVWNITPTPGLTHVVISQFRTRGPSGGNDEFIEIYNPTSAIVNVSGWIIRGSNANGFVGDRFTFPANTQLDPGKHYMIANNSAQGYSGSVAPDQAYNSSLTDDGGIALTLPDGTIIDQVGMSAGSVFREGSVLVPLTTNEDRAYERKLGGGNGNCYDSSNNAADFAIVNPSAPRNFSSAPIFCATTMTPTPGASITPGGPTPTASATSTASTVVSLQNNSFNPATLTIPRGTKIIWKNNDTGNHTVTSGVPGTINNKFRSPILSSTQTYEFTFNETGTFQYFCEIHGQAMTGTITVQ